MTIVRYIPFLFIIIYFACDSPNDGASPYTAYTGATLIDGSGDEPVEDGVLLIRDGRVVATGSDPFFTRDTGRR